MKILNWLKNKYWLWGFSFGLIIIIIDIVILFLNSSFNYSFINKYAIFFLIFCTISSELLFRILILFKKSKPNSIFRIISIIILVIILPTVLAIGFYLFVFTFILFSTLD